MTVEDVNDHTQLCDGVDYTNDHAKLYDVDHTHDHTYLCNV